MGAGGDGPPIRAYLTNTQPRLGKIIIERDPTWDGMAKILVNMDIEIDDALAEKVVELLGKATEREIPEGLELEVNNVGGKLILKVVEGGKREAAPKG